MLSLKLNSDDYKRKISFVLSDSVEAILRNTQLSIVEGFRKFPKPPIKSGQLRSNIDTKMTGSGKGNIISRKNYSVYVEYGTYKMAPRPFMRNGVKDAEDSNMEILKKRLENI